MLLRVGIPSYRRIDDDQEKSYTVYIIEVCWDGRTHTVEKRYSELESLHKKVKKKIRTPEFPPKKMMKWNHKVLEQRRAALETYLQGVLDRENVPRLLLSFLQVDCDSESIDTLDKSDDVGPSHQPVLAFSENVFASDPKDGLADVISCGVLQGFYDDMR